MTCNRVMGDREPWPTFAISEDEFLELVESVQERHDKEKRMTGDKTTKTRLETVCNNEHAKRAAEVALAGDHWILFVGAWDSQASALADFVNGFAIPGSFAHIDVPAEASAKALTPCPCGHYGEDARECTCSLEMVIDWRRKYFPAVPADITVEVVIPDALRLLKWLKAGYQDGEPQERVVARIVAARGRDPMPALPDEASYVYLRAAIQQLHMGPLQVKSIMAVADTIARLAGSDVVRAAHMAEAIQYRPREWWTPAVPEVEQDDDVEGE